MSLPGLETLIKLVVGFQSDSANASGTLMARWAELLTNRLTSARAAALDNLSGVNSSVGASADAAEGGGAATGTTQTLQSRVRGIADNRIGNTADAANAAGTLMARLSELLTNRITSARAAFLDATISSRASATDYTATRAGYLDQLGLALTSQTALFIGTTYTTGVSSILAKRVTVTNPSTTLTQAFSITGRGSLLLLNVLKESASTNSVITQITITLDGVIIATNVSGGQGTVVNQAPLVGSFQFTSSGTSLTVAPPFLPFNTSIKVEVNFNTGPGNTPNILVDYLAIYR